MQALTAGVSPEGQKLFMAISKTIGRQVTWSGSDIVVFGDTVIMPPYRPENVRGSCERQLVYVKKLVESQWKDVASAPASANASADPASVSTTSSGGSSSNNNYGSMSNGVASATGDAPSNATAQTSNASAPTSGASGN